MDIDPIELLREIEQRFPKELTICVQAIQIRMLQEQIPEEQDRE